MGWWSPLRSSPQLSTHPGLCSLTSGFRYLRLLPPHLSPCLGPVLATLQARPFPQPWPLQTPEVPADSTQSCTWLFLGLWSPFGPFCCPVPPVPLLHRGQATSLGLYRPSQPARRLPGLATEPKEVLRRSPPHPAHQEPCSQDSLLLLSLGTSILSLGSTIITEHLGLLPCQTNPLQPMPALGMLPSLLLTTHLRPCPCGADAAPVAASVS